MVDICTHNYKIAESQCWVCLKDVDHTEQWIRMMKPHCPKDRWCFETEQKENAELEEILDEIVRSGSN